MASHLKLTFTDAAQVLSAETRGSELSKLLSSTPTCILRPHAFFVSWQGVVTLAYRSDPVHHVCTFLSIQSGKRM